MADLTYSTITLEEDYLRLTGVDLNEDLKARLTDDIGDGNPAPRFIYQVENYLKEKIVDHNRNYGQIEKREDHPNYNKSIFDDDYTFNQYKLGNNGWVLDGTHQTKQFKRATCYQISYLLKNGNVTNNISDLFTREQMDKLGLDKNAERCLFIGGLWNIARC